VVFIGAYWSARQASRREAAEKTAQFLEALSAVGEPLSNWFLKGSSKAGAGAELGRSETEIGPKLQTNRRDIGGDDIPELGFSLGVWNGKDATLSLHLGSTSARVLNSVVLSFRGTSPEAHAGLWHPVLGSMIELFDPDHAVVTSNEILTQAKAKNPWEVGRLTYERGRGVVEHPTLLST